jgi:hypothetical protein
MQAAAASDAPVLMLWGGAETRHSLWSSTWDELPVEDKEQVVVEGGDHLYVGREDAVTRAIDAFVRRH